LVDELDEPELDEEGCCGSWARTGDVSRRVQRARRTGVEFRMDTV
jgi:hypothetical protein